MGKIYKTAQGKTLDMAALALQNERIRAVSNMNMNARGDIVDSSNNVVKSRVQQTNQAYKRSVGQNFDVGKSTAPAPKSVAPTIEQTQPQPVPVSADPLSGLAAAMARAQQLKDGD